MIIQFSEQAVARLEPHLKNGDKQLKLLYDTEGCGCVVSGVPALQLIDQPGDHDRLGDGSPIAFWHEPRFEVFFEPKMRVDYNPERGQFILKSDSQIYTNRLQLITAS